MNGRAVFICAFVAAIAVIGGCASVPMAGANEDARAKSFVAPPAGQASLYVYRNESYGAVVKMPLLLDNMAIGDTAAHTYAFRQVPPGKHVLVSKSENDASLQFNAEAGKTYFVWQEVKMGVWQPSSLLHIVDDKTGEDAVRDCKLIQ